MSRSGDGSVFLGKAVNFEAKERLSESLAPVVDKVGGLRSYARLIRVTPGAVSKWMSGDSFPNGDNRVRVANSLGMSLEEFDTAIVRGIPIAEKDSLEQKIAWIRTASKPELAKLLRLVAEQLEAV